MRRVSASPQNDVATAQCDLLDVFFRAVRAELAKLRSLPPIGYTLGGTIALTVLLSLLFVREAEITTGSKGTAGTVNILDFGVAVLGWSQVGFFLVGVMASTSEYVGGQIRTTLIATPDRLLQRLAANVALAMTVFTVALLTVATSIGTASLASGIPISDLNPLLVAQSVFNATGCLTCMALLSAGLGVLIRKTIPAAAILLVYLLIMSPLLQSQNWYFLPDMASYALWYATAPPQAPPAILCWVVVVAWTAASLVPATVLFLRRDT